MLLIVFTILVMSVISISYYELRKAVYRLWYTAFSACKTVRRANVLPLHFFAIFCFFVRMNVLQENFDNVLAALRIKIAALSGKIMNMAFGHCC